MIGTILRYLNRIRIRYNGFSVLAALVLFSVPCRRLEAGQDTLRSTSVSTDTLETKKSRSRVSQLLTDWIYAAPVDTTFSGVEALESVKPFIPFEGRYIRNIIVVRLNIFGDSRVGESQEGKPWIVRTGNRLHIDTRERIIANYFLMDEGDRVEPYVLADTERILRRRPFIQDAKIEVVPVPEQPDSVDLLVVIRDVWSIGIRPTIREYNSYRIKVYDRNFLGFGHDIEYEADVNLDRDRRLDNVFIYRMTNLYGSFIDLAALYEDTHERERAQLSLVRGFVSPEIRYTGALTIGEIENWAVNPYDVRNSYQLRDFWMGRSFLLGSSDTEGAGRVRAILAGRVQRIDYYVQPPVHADTNRTYHDRTLLLGSLSLAKTEYRKAKLIFGYGTTEDIQYGFLFSLTGGHQSGEFDDRPYTGADIGFGKFIGRTGYVSGTARVGTFFRNGKSEDGVVDLMSGAFTPLHQVGRYFFRHFATVHYTWGFSRREENGLELEGRNGIIEVGNIGLEGKQRLVLNYESVLFTPWDWYKFRLAFFGFVSSGNLGDDWNPFQRNDKYYTSFGLGIRIHNERLVFDPLEIRFIFFPSVPPDASTTWYHIGTVRRLPFPNFDPRAPSTVPYY